MSTKTVILASGSSWTVPADAAGPATVHCFGAGVDGAGGGSGRGNNGDGGAAGLYGAGGGGRSTRRRM